MSIHVDGHALVHLREQVARKDSAARALGVALAEYELEKAELGKATLTDAEKFLRLGALQSEFDGYRDLHMAIVIKANEAQRRIGEAALGEIGLATDARNFTIDQETGEVLELVAGAYVPMEAAL